MMKLKTFVLACAAAIGFVAFSNPSEVLVSNVSTSVSQPWAPVATVDYTVSGDIGGRDLVLRLEYLNGEESWQKVQSEAVSGELSLAPGRHSIVVSLADLEVYGYEADFRFVVRERQASKVVVNNTDGWTVDAQNAYGGAASWRSRAISNDKKTSLFATTLGAGELTFAWKTSSEEGYDILECLVDGERQDDEISGEMGWTECSIVFDDSEEHQIAWRYRKDESVKVGQDCGWVAKVEMFSVEPVSGTQFVVTLPTDAAEISLNARLDENGMVVLEADNPDAKIYFTTNGAAPTAESEQITGPVDWSVFRTMKAVALDGTGMWSEMHVGRDYVWITLDPVLGSVSPAAIIRRIGDKFGDLPAPTRDGCEFTGWTWDRYNCSWSEWNGVSADSFVEAKNGGIFATWDVADKRMIIDPRNSFESLDYNFSEWSYFGRTYRSFGYDDEETGEYIETNRVWQEYLQVQTETTNVFLSATFNGAGKVEFGHLSGNIGMSCLVDGEKRELVWGEGGKRYYGCCSVKVLSSGEHLLELFYPETEWDLVCDVGGMVWTSAPAQVTVAFDAMGGTVGQTSKTYDTGAAYGSFPTPNPREGYEFLGWFTDPVGGEQKSADDLVDFEVTKLCAHWRADLATALDNTTLAFSSSGATGWDGQCGVSHDGNASAASGWLEWNETNVLSTTVSGKGVLNFWWKKEDGRGEWGDDDPFGMLLMLEVDGKAVRLQGYGEAEKRADGWLRFSYPIVAEGNHTIKWKAAIDSDYYNEDSWYVRNGKSVREAKEDWLGGELIAEPGAWVDQVEWLPGADQTDVVQWAHSAFQAERILPGSSDPMMAWCNQRLEANPNDYEARVRRAITRLKVLSENPVFREILAQYGYEFCDDLMAVFGELNVDNAPLSNDAVDAVAAEVLPALADILADLDAIPENWVGTVALSPEQYPVDEDIYIDAADVIMTKAFVHGARAAVLAAQGYDLSIDNQKMYEEVVAASNRKSIVISEFTGDWNDCQVSRMQCFGSDGWFRIASQGAKLLVQLTLPETLPEECEVDDVELWLDFSRYDEEEDESVGYFQLSLYPLAEGANVSYGRWSEWIDGKRCSTNFSGMAVGRRIEGRTVELEFDFAAYEQLAGRLPGFEMDDATISWDMPDDWFSISADGDEYDPSLTAEAILAAHPQFGGRIRKPESLASSKTEVRTALDLYEAFDAAVRGRTSGKMHFFEYDPEYDEQWAAVAKQVKLAKESLDGVVTVKGEDFACFGHSFKQTDLTERVSLKPFFDGKILRSLLPPFVGDRPVLDAIPDITFAGMFPDRTMENSREWLELIDGVWNGTPQVLTNTITYVGLEGAVNANVTTFTTNDLPLVLGPVEREGYRFLGWTPNGGVIPEGTVTNVTFTATWEKIVEPPVDDPPVDPVVTNTITYVGLEGAVNANVTTFTTNDLPLVLGPVEREGYRFLGWTPNGGVIPEGTVTNVTFTATWEKIVEPTVTNAVACDVAIEDPAPTAEEAKPLAAADVTKAQTFNGYLTNVAAEVVGSVTVKITKQGKVTATVKLPDGVGSKALKTFSYAGTLGEGGRAELSCGKNGGRMVIDIGQKIVSGTVAQNGGTYGITGRLGTKDALKAVDSLKGKVWSVALTAPTNGVAHPLMRGCSALTVTAAKQGKVKVAGFLADGTKVSASAQGLVFGSDTVVVPLNVALYKGKAGGFSLKLKIEGDRLTVGNASEWTAVIDGKTYSQKWDMVFVSPKSELADGAVFVFDAEDLPDDMDDICVASTNGTPVLPDGVAVEVEGNKWKLPKAGKVVLTKDKADLDVAKFTAKGATEPNPAALKLTYAAKAGTFKGSFALYRKVSETKLKKVAVTVNGTVVDDGKGGVGYGSAVIKKTASIPLALRRDL